MPSVDFENKAAAKATVDKPFMMICINPIDTSMSNASSHNGNPWHIFLTIPLRTDDADCGH